MEATEILREIGKGKSLYAMAARECANDEALAKQLMVEYADEFKDSQHHLIKYFGEKFFIDFQVYCLINNLWD